MTTKAVSAALPFDCTSGVLAKTVKKSAMPPLVIQIFSPLRIQSLPSRRAVVRTAAASEPAPGSVRQKAAIISPVVSFGSQRAFCASVPKRSRPRMPMELCAPTVRAIEPSNLAISCSTRE